MRILFYLIILLIPLLTGCAPRPFAYNHNIPVYDMWPNSSELGVSPVIYRDDKGLTLPILSIWYRRNLSKWLDIGFGSFTVSSPILGPEIIFGRMPVKVMVGIYHNPLALIIDKDPAPPWWQANLLFGVGKNRLHFYGGIRTSPMAIGPLIGTNYDFEEYWSARGEGSFLYPPFWNKSVVGRGYTASIALVRKF